MGDTGRLVSDSETRIGAKLKKHDLSSRIAVSPYRIRRLEVPSRATMIHCLIQTVSGLNPRPTSVNSGSSPIWSTTNDQTSVRTKSQDSWNPPRNIVQGLLGQIYTRLVTRQQFC